MGTNNKQRRAAKKRRKDERARAAAQRTGSSGHAGGDKGDRTALVIEILLHALEIGPDDRIFAQVIGQLDRHHDAGPVVNMLFQEQLGALWEHGWCPADVVHVVRRNADHDAVLEVGRRLVADGAIHASEGRALHPRWQRQLNDIDAELLEFTPRRVDTVLAAVLALHAIGSLQGVIPVVAPPGDVAAGLPEGTRIDGRMLARVRALLAQAESTTYEEEAEAFMAKAQELIARHAIDEARLHTVEEVGHPGTRRIYIEDPYGQEKANVLAAVGTANRCRLVWDGNHCWVTVFGYDQDQDAVELIGTSLLAQATAAMLRHGSTQDATGRSRTRSFRHAFLLGFAQRIGERLRQATDEQVADADQPERFVPVLAARSDRVDEFVRRYTDPGTRSRMSISNGAGWHAGQDAADEAQLDVGAKPLRGG